MLKLYFAPRTRAVRVAWLLEELALPYALERVEFLPNDTKFYQQKTPFGKLPVLEDGPVVMFESGAIIEYVLETYGDGRLAPPPSTPERARYLQWFHFAESSAFPPVGILARWTIYRDEGDRFKDVVDDARNRATTGFDLLERELAGNAYLTGDDFTAADIMMGFTLAAANIFGLITDRHPNLNGYFARLTARPAFQKVGEL